MENTEFINKLSVFFKTKYQDFINLLICEINDVSYSIDISEYTSKTISYTHTIIQEYMNFENIENDILSFPNGFKVNFETFLFSLVQSEKTQIDLILFKKILENNFKFSEK